ncbi:MAG: CDP-alcohol phosphatidyltransferase family protein [Novosphingobium sp.]
MRPRELQDALNHHLYHPLAWRLARTLARTRVTPNMVSVAGGLAVASAGAAYAGPLWGLAWPGSAVAGLALHMAWHVIDGADGDLARITGRSSPRGEMVDGLCDYAGHFAMYLLLAALLAAQVGPIGWAAMTAVGVAHAVQANHVEVQRRFYLHWVHGKPWLANQRPAVRGPFAWLVALYLRAGAGMSPHAAAIDRAVTAAGHDPLRREALRALVREESAPLLRIERWLGPNQRTIALGLSMLLTASPLAYAGYVLVWQSALLAVSVVRHNRAALRIAARIAALG